MWNQKRIQKMLNAKDVWINLKKKRFTQFNNFNTENLLHMTGQKNSLMYYR